jgi:hypothetical protein
VSLPNENWPRWIFASIADRFKTVADGLNIPILVEGIDEREAAKIRTVSHVELRVHGPETNEISHNYFQLHVEINLLLTQLNDGAKQNSYQLIQFCGVLQKAASGSIPIYRFGPDTLGVDDSTLVGCLSPDPLRNRAITVFHFGEIDRDRRIRQSAVDGRYVVFLHN